MLHNFFIPWLLFPHSKFLVSPYSIANRRWKVHNGCSPVLILVRIIGFFCHWDNQSWAFDNIYLCLLSCTKWTKIWSSEICWASASFLVLYFDMFSSWRKLMLLRKFLFQWIICFITRECPYHMHSTVMSIRARTFIFIFISRGVH